MPCFKFQLVHLYFFMEGANDLIKEHGDLNCTKGKFLNKCAGTIQAKFGINRPEFVHQ